MRCVILDGRNGPQTDMTRRDKLAGHLHARLAEYEEEGIRPQLEEGGVRAGISGLSGRQAAALLAEHGVFALAEGDCVRFLMGPGVSFEDLDYVQGVAAKLL